RLKKVLTNTFILMASTLIPLILLMTFSAQAHNSLQAYWMKQVIGSLGGEVTVSGRLYILGVLVSQLIVPLLVALFALLIFRNRIRKNSAQNYRKISVVLMITGLCAVVPVMISMKQRSFYILDSMPLFALMIAIPFWAFLQEPVTRLHNYSPASKPLKYVALLMLVLSLAGPACLARYNKRDQKILSMIHEISTVVPAGSTIRIKPLLYSGWNLHSYFSRYSGISLDPSDNPAALYYLAPDSSLQGDSIATQWIPVRQSNGFTLFKK
ncbi:MAG: hypothetical protein PHY99_08410, partial [Bacteroidales bacterium]|nr:hypothetical protein [Bacteroidales bacterium]